MNPTQLLAHFERIIDAPDAILRLRRFILDLAVRGKLGPQDPKDEPASQLQMRIAAEKARLVKTGELRKEKPLPDIRTDELPFDLPRGWEWVRIRKITSDRGQMVPDKDFTYIDVTAINKEVGRIEDAKITSAAEAPSRARKIVRKGDVLYSCVRPYLLNIAIVETEISPSPIASTAFAILNGFGLVIAQYQWVVLRSPFFVACVEEKMRGQAYPAINDSDFALLPFPLPPLAEQHRIVAKINELMALCDRLEGARIERENRRDRLAAASLSSLNTPDPDSFQNDARFALSMLGALTARPDQVKHLRQTILNLAVLGKLTPQSRRDKSPELADAACKERPDELPTTWRYARLANLLSEETRNGYSRKPDEAPHGTPILRISAGTLRGDGVVAEEEHKLISGIDAATRVQYGLRSGDLLACRFNGNKAFVGRLTIFHDYLGMRPIYPDKLIRVRVAVQLVIPAFLQIAGGAENVRRQIEEVCATTVGNWGISASNLKEIRFPIPPLAEQHRIVVKFREIMALCDQLESSLQIGGERRSGLLTAILSEALRPVDERDEAA